MAAPAGIVIGSTPDDVGREWLSDLLKSVNTIYPVVIDWTYGFELHSIALGSELFDEFVFLPQSTIIINNALWMVVFEQCRGKAVSLSNTPSVFGMYLGKYLSEDVKKTTIPTVISKDDAIQREITWTADYASRRAYFPLCDMPHTDVFEYRHGRKNMVTENLWLRRYKGSWGQ